MYSNLFKMSKLGLVMLLLLVQILILQVQTMAYESKACAFDLKTDEVEDHQISGATTEISTEEESKAAEAPHIRRLGKHHSTDKSVAGGGVIIGGLVTAIVAAIFCYIRVTRKRNSSDC